LRCLNPRASVSWHWRWLGCCGLAAADSAEVPRRVAAPTVWCCPPPPGARR
jgi:hypothetical protein